MADCFQESAKDPFRLPSKEVLQEIERKQNERAAAIRERRLKDSEEGNDERSAAAGIIQRNYRGHRERRALNGFGLDPGTRWMEVIMKFILPVYGRIANVVG